MRTTIRIEDGLYRRLKARAAETGRTVGELVEDAVREALGRRPARPTKVRSLPVYGGSGVLPGVDLASNVALRERMDDDAGLDALR